MALILNFFGGPGVGKSTTAALTFAHLKMRGVKCELVTEFAKELTWEKRHFTLENQQYILAKQHKRMWAPIKNGVDVIVTDSPLLIGSYYSSLYGSNDHSYHEIQALARSLHEEHPSLNMVIRRTKPYQQYGRNQSEPEARDIDVGIRDMLDNMGIDYCMVESAEVGLDDILEKTMSYLAENA